jgi:hypothetical protein
VFQLGLVLTELFTGRNPCEIRADILDPVYLHPLGHIPGLRGAGITALLKRMLVMNSDLREPAQSFMDPFFGVFADIAARLNGIEGRVIQSSHLASG